MPRQYYNVFNFLFALISGSLVILRPTPGFTNDCQSPHIIFCPNCEAKGTITVGKNIQCQLYYKDVHGIEKIEVAERPSHGRVLIEQAPRPDPEGVVINQHIIYIPASGYVGKDRFAVRVRVKTLRGTAPDPEAASDAVSYDVDVVDRASTAPDKANPAATAVGADLTVEFIESALEISPNPGEYNGTIVHVFRLGIDNKVSFTSFYNGRKTVSQEVSLGSNFLDSDTGCTESFRVLGGRLKFIQECLSYTRSDDIVTDGKSSCRASISYGLKPGHTTFDRPNKSRASLAASHVACHIANRGV